MISKTQVNEEEELQPLYIELSSTLNVELVYVILKSITSFAFLARSHDSVKTLKRKEVRVDHDAATGDATLSLPQIKIRNPN